MGGKIRKRQASANGLEIPCHDLSQLPAVKAGPTLGSQGAQGTGQIGVSEQFPHPGRLAPGEIQGTSVIEFLNRPGALFKTRQVGGETRRYDRRQWESGFGVIRGRLQNLCHIELAPTAVQGEPTIYRTGHRDRQGAVGGNAGIALGQPTLRPQLFNPRIECVKILPRGTAPRTVVTVQSFLLGVPDDGEQIAANAVAGGLHETQGSVGRNGRIHRATPSLENVQGDLGCQWLRCSRHAPGAVNGAA